MNVDISYEGISFHSQKFNLILYFCALQFPCYITTDNSIASAMACIFSLSVLSVADEKRSPKLNGFRLSMTGFAAALW